MANIPPICARLAENGIPSVLVPATRVDDIRRDLADVEKAYDLNGFQKWVISDLYHLSPPDDLPFPARSVLLLAVRAPFATRVLFARNGREHAFLCLSGGDDAPMISLVTDALAEGSYHGRHDGELPLKRMAAKTGLAMYGRCNVTFREDWGSSYVLHAFWTDMPCPDGCDPWLPEPVVSPRCEGCHICENACPTHALEPGRFLLNTDRCLSFLNEGPGDLPDWVPASAHRTLYDCLHCLSACPMNEKARKNVTGPVAFTEAETALLLAGTPWAELPESVRERLDSLRVTETGMGYYKVTARNLRLMLEAAEADAPEGDEDMPT